MTMYGKCRICGCTDNNPCHNPEHGYCRWTDDSHTLCSHCADKTIANDPATVHCVNTPPAMRNLTLPLKKRWYRLIESGIKKEEYRDLSPYWCKRLLCSYNPDYVDAENVNDIAGAVRDGEMFFKEYDTVTFTLGYPPASDTSRRMTFEIIDIRIGRGRPEWGAEEKEQFIITIGDKL